VNLPYYPRLICLCLASFYLVHLVAGLGVSAFTGIATRTARRWQPRNGTRFLLALRLAPAILAACSVAGVCVPSYLWMEPDFADEPVGWFCALALTLCVAIWANSASRTVRAAIRSRQYAIRLQETACPMAQGESGASFWVTDSPGPVMALTGIARPRLIVSRQVLDGFSAEEMNAALRHEEAHRIWFDNLKRLVLLMTPDVAPGARAFHRLEQSWAHLSEWAADDYAAGGTVEGSLSMASALVRAARMHSTPLHVPELMTGLLASENDLGARVDRLLQPRESALNRPRSTFPACGLAITAVLTVSLTLRPATLQLAHEMLERLIH
jgi:hypothetical protein